jgi:hypothetical protein
LTLFQLTTEADMKDKQALCTVAKYKETLNPLNHTESALVMSRLDYMIMLLLFRSGC